MWVEIRHYWVKGDPKASLKGSSHLQFQERLVRFVVFPDEVQFPVCLLAACVLLTSYAGLLPLILGLA